MTSTDTLVIETEALTKAYGPSEVVKAINLKVPRHSIFGFLGPNGAGKSTTMGMLIGAIRPTRGSAQVFGLDIQKDSDRIRERVGFLTQDTQFYPDLTPRQTLQFCASFFPPLRGERLADRIQATLELVGLAGKEDRQVKGFSGGEKQRLGLAQAYVHRPELIILDEPAAALDPMGRMDVLQVMQKLRQQATIFYSTHILDDVQRVSDHVAILHHGELITQGPLDQVMAQGEGIVYVLTTRGDVAPVQRALAGQSWVSSLTPKASQGQIQWEIGVLDPALAEAHLLRMVLADPATTVVAFGRKTYDLESIFLDLVGDPPHG
ncbi:MAG: ABC transporter ATP-binding protein [Nodosilinea sp.]